MIEVKLRDVINSAEVMRTLSTQQLKGKVAFRVARLLRELEKEFTLFNEKRADLIKEYGQKDENGELKTNENGDFMLEPERAQEFYNMMDELLNTDLSINAEKIAFEDIENVEFTPTQILSIENFIEE